MKKIVLLAFVLVLLSTAVVVGSIRPAVADGTIYIRSDGSVEGTDKIQRDGDIYTFTGIIYDEIVVERDNIVVDGVGYTLQGTESGTGISVPGRSNVTIMNMTIKAFSEGIHLGASSNNTISGNTITANKRAGIELYSSNNTIVGNNITANDGVGILGVVSNNTISGNNITNNSDRGIYLSSSLNNSISGNNIAANSRDGIFLFYYSNSNSISGNNITNNGYGYGISGSGIYLYGSSNNSIAGNNITNNKYGIILSSSSNNIIYHNNFINNAQQVYDEGQLWGKPPSTNIWDNGYFSCGNYWSDYTGVDANGDGIGDTPYVINENNQDNYPLMSSWSPTWSPLPAEEEEVPLWMQWWLWAIVAVVIVALAGAVYFLKKRKPPTPTAPTPPTEGTLQNTTQNTNPLNSYLILPMFPS